MRPERVLEETAEERRRRLTRVVRRYQAMLRDGTGHDWWESGEVAIALAGARELLRDHVRQHERGPVFHGQ